MYHPLGDRGNHSLDSDPHIPLNAQTAAGSSSSKPSIFAKMSAFPMSERDKHIPLNNLYPPSPDIERGTPGGSYTRINDHLTPGTAGHGSNMHTPGSRETHFFQEATSYDYRKGPEHYRVAQGDIPDTKITRFYQYLLGASIVTRWTLFIVPILGLLWIPGILGLTATPDGHIWNTRLIWWSIWFSVWWAGYWAALAFAYILPGLVRYTLGVVAVELRKYINWLSALRRYVAVFVWALASFISFTPLIKNNQKNPSSNSVKAVDICTKVLLGILICAAILLAEKILIQAIATQFHERSYAERLEIQRHNTRTLVILYTNSSDQPGRFDTLHDNAQGNQARIDPNRLLKGVLKGVKGVAQSTTQAFGNIATEIVGSSVLQPNSPQAIVAQALNSANKTRLLARRIFYSFRKNGSDEMYVKDIEEFFESREAAMDAFAMFDRDNNGDATRDEVELACMDLHRERLALANSMSDIDSAVGRLDNILMTLYIFVAAIVFAVTLDSAVSTLLSGAAAFILALSWLIGASMQEILASIIFLFVKLFLTLFVVYDVGDRVDIDGTTFTVKEIRLLSTIFIDTRGCQVQAPNSLLNTKFIYNHRRSQQMSEPFTFDVAWDTTFEQLEALRARMLAFVKDERRDFLPVFDVIVDNFSDQSKMSVKADIKYKSNWQQGALRVQRRNKWICALKGALKELKIFGPSGDPGAVADPKEITMVPWDEVVAKKNKPTAQPTAIEPLIPKGDFQLIDRNQVVLDQSQDVYGEGKDMGMTAPKQTAGMRQRVAYQGGNMGGNIGAGSQAPRPTAETAFQGQQAAAANAAASAAAGNIIISEINDGN